MILDVASGTAGVALQIEERGGVKVVGVDLTRRCCGKGAGGSRPPGGAAGLAWSPGGRSDSPSPMATSTR